MLTLIGMAGSAAAVKILNRKQKPADVRELEEQKQTLQKLVDTISKDAQLAQADKAQQLLQMQREAEELKARLEELQKQNESLREDVQVHKEQHDEVVLQNQQLSQLTQTLTHEKEVLVQKVECLAVEHEEQLREYQAQVDQLREKVSAIVTRMLAHSISDADAAEAVRELGCEITFIEAAPTATAPSTASDVSSDSADIVSRTPSIESAAAAQLAWTAQPSMLLEDRERLERWVASSMMTRSSSSASSSAAAGLMPGGGAARIPVITFPNMPALPPKPARANSLLANGAAGSLLPNKAPAAAGGLDSSRSSHDDCDVAPNRDQQQQQSVAVASTPAVKAAPSHSTTPSKGPRPNIVGPSSSTTTQQPPSAKHFTYSMQGKPGSQWLSRVPAAMDQQQQQASAATTLFSTSTSSPTLLTRANPLTPVDSQQLMMDDPLERMATPSTSWNLAARC